MKSRLFLLFAIFITIATPKPVLAQETVTTGVVMEAVPQKGTLTVRSDQTKGPLTFTNITGANIFTIDGSPAQLSDLAPGTKVTIQYATQGGRLVVAKIMFGEPKPLSGGTGTSSGTSNIISNGGIVPRSGMNPTGYPDQTSRVAPLNTTGRSQ